MKRIYLVGKYKGLYTTVDDEDYEALSKYRWYAQNSDHGNRFYAITHDCKDQIRVAVLMHRLIMNPPKGHVIDHVNRNTLDNRKCNLRLCTQKENNRNRGLSSQNTSGYKGVLYIKEYKVYQAVISCNTKHYYLGRYDNPRDAAEAYNKKAKELFGEFAWLNNLRNNI